MEDTLGETEEQTLKLLFGLNPCYNGRYSLSFLKIKEMKNFIIWVLILVIMEDAL